MSTDEEHLSFERLECIADGEPIPDDVREHLESCSTCRRTLAEVEENLVIQGRLLHASDEVSPEEPLDLPGYSQLTEIGRGGQGIIYRALQTTTGQEVAIKVLREGRFDDAGERSRFEREVRVLGRLRHPNIVPIHDCGTSRGRVYFVMDFIEGLPLDRFLEKSSLSLRRRVELFATICDAVQAAHLQGVLHRDLKPSNIRVTQDGVPYLLDFGLAKMLEDEEGSSDTASGQFLGSLPWSSPEQLGGSPSAIDLRTDVYALGVVLYQALTDEFPYDVHGSLRETVDQILTRDPRPLAHLDRRWGGELQTIVFKCLQKYPDRRYQTAGALAEDLRRLLGGAPIEAKADSTWYVLRKRLVRHRLAALVVAVLLLTGSVGFAMTWSAWRKASDEAETSKSVVAILSEILGSPDPHTEFGKDFTVYELVRRFASRLDRSSIARPEVEAVVRELIGKTLSHLGDNALAREQLSLAMDLWQRSGDDDPERLASLHIDRGWLRHELEEHAQAATDFREAARLARVTHNELQEGQALTGVADTWTHLGRASEAEPLALRAVELARRGGAEFDFIAHAIFTLALARREAGKPRQALPSFEEAARLLQANVSGGHPLLLVIQREQAALLLALDRTDEAERILREALDGGLVTLPESHHQLAEIRSQLGECLLRREAWAEAEPLLLRAFQAVEPIESQRELARSIAAQLARLTRASQREVEARDWERRAGK